MKKVFFLWICTVTVLLVALITLAAISFSEPEHPDYTSLFFETFNSYGLFYCNADNAREAKRFVSQSLSLADEFRRAGIKGINYPKVYWQSYARLFLIYEEENNEEKARHFLKLAFEEARKYADVDESLSLSEKKKRLRTAILKYDTELFQKGRLKWREEKTSHSKGDVKHNKNIGDSSDKSNEIVEESTATNFIKKSRGKSLTVPGVLLKMEYVRPGTFRMGSNNETGNYYKHIEEKIKFRQEFWIGKYEVTQAQYKRIMGKNPSFFNGKDKPIEYVSWNEATKFCQSLTTHKRKAGRLVDNYAYRLPTEAEWEYAAQGGQESEGSKYSGGNDIDKVAWYKENSEYQTHDVGQKKANALGLHDMHGNVWEWCLDRYGGGKCRENDQNNPLNRTEYRCRVFRGGSWMNIASDCRIGSRSGEAVNARANNAGFRVVLAHEIEH